MPENQWKYPDRPELGLMNIVNRMIRDLDATNSSALPTLRRGSTILVGSDYSGQHSRSAYESLSFVLADIEHCQNWMARRCRLRAGTLDDRRRFSYKALRDRRRSSVISDFLSAADEIPGLLVVVLTRKSIKSLFKTSGRIERTDREIRSLAHWAPHVVEKLLRIVHFLSLFLSGLSREGQDVLWLTDEDDIAANPQKHRELTTTFGKIFSHYLRHNLRHVRIGTTASDTGKRDVEDFVAVADLAAGALCEVLNAYLKGGVLPTPGLFLPPPIRLDKKALNILNWFSDCAHSLKRLVLSIEPVEDSTSLSIRQLTFHGSNSYLT
jgi:hypothetical protein